MKRTPLRRKAAKKKRTTSPRCDKQRCDRRAEVEIVTPFATEAGPLPEGVPHLGPVGVMVERFCKQHAKKLADKLARQVVLYRDGYRCQRCGKTDREGAVIQWAHIIRRGALSIRWKEDNAVALCAECHVFFTYREEEWRTWLDLNYPGLWDRLNWTRLTAIAAGDKPGLAQIITDLRQKVPS